MSSIAHERVAGEFVRQDDAFDAWVTADGRSGYPAAAGRYHLYVSLACPWAHRTVIVRKLKGLEDAIGMTVVDPIRDERGWAFRDGPGFEPDPVNGLAVSQRSLLRDRSGLSRPRHRPGRCGTPRRKRIVSNNDDDIMRMFETRVRRVRDDATISTSIPAALRSEIDALNDEIYEA